MSHTAIVVGAGSYVLGDSFGDGVILPTLLDAARRGDVGRIVLATRTPRTDAFWQRVNALRTGLGAEAVVIDELVIASPASLTDAPLDRDARAFVAIPDAHHAEYIEAFLRAGVPTWTVKPLTGRGAESRQLHALATEAGVPLWVDYHKRFDDSNRKLKALVDDGSVGRPVILSVQYSQPWRIPLGDLAAWSSDVDVFQYIGCHYVDLAFYLMPNARATRVSATGLAGRLAAEGGPAFDVVHAVIDLALGDAHNVRLDLRVGWSDPSGAPAKSHQRVDASFERGRAIVDQKERGFQLWRDDAFEQVNPYFFQLLPDPDAAGASVAGYGPESIRRFLAYCRAPGDVANERLLPLSGEACRTDEVLDAVRASLATNGAWIPVD